MFAPPGRKSFAGECANSRLGPLDEGARVLEVQATSLAGEVDETVVDLVAAIQAGETDMSRAPGASFRANGDAVVSRERPRVGWTWSCVSRSVQTVRS